MLLWVFNVGVLLRPSELRPAPVMPSRGVETTDTAVSHTQQHPASDPSQTTDGVTPRASFITRPIYEAQGPSPQPDEPDEKTKI